MHYVCYNRRKILGDYSQHFISLLLELVIRLTQGHLGPIVLREKHNLFTTFIPLLCLYFMFFMISRKLRTLFQNSIFKHFVISIDTCNTQLSHGYTFGNHSYMYNQEPWHKSQVRLVHFRLFKEILGTIRLVQER